MCIEFSSYYLRFRPLLRGGSANELEVVEIEKGQTRCCTSTNPQALLGGAVAS